MFRLLFRQLHVIKTESNLFFPVSRITLETKEDQTKSNDHSKARIPDTNQM